MHLLKESISINLENEKKKKIDMILCYRLNFLTLKLQYHYTNMYSFFSESAYPNLLYSKIFNPLYSLYTEDKFLVERSDFIAVKRPC